MRSPPVEVLYEDNHLLVVNKPAGLATMGLAAGQETLLERAKAYIKDRYQKPGAVYLGTVSRLDAPVTGVVLFARTSKAAARLTEQFRSRSVEKLYWALVEGDAPAEGHLVDWVRKDERHRKMHIASPKTPGAQEARLSFRLLRRLKSASWLEVQLETGRKHQIRLQLSHHNLPILGDRKYGAQTQFPAGIALHARKIAFDHPTRRERMELTAPTPNSWKRWGVSEDADTTLQ